MPDSNNTPCRGCSYKSNSIYLEGIRSELMEIQWKCGYFPDLEIDTISANMWPHGKILYLLERQIYTSSMQF